ncbi:MAG: DUF4968 domain-containing protein [Prevotellaceae bacterium]|jgi:alpha-D-xyloside xylohydrolase|nr:DUF4968 domain-containing protein [Prevotellaceae bacterium]
MKKFLLTTFSIACLFAFAIEGKAQLQINGGAPYLMNVPKDMSTDFFDMTNIFFFANQLSAFDPATAEGTINWQRSTLVTRQAFNSNIWNTATLRMRDFPGRAYVNNPDLKFKLDFVSPRTIRIRILTSPIEPESYDSPMLVKEPNTGDPSWKLTQNDDAAVVYTSPNGSITVEKNPWRMIFRDAKGKILTKTERRRDMDSTQVKILPFNFVKRGSDNSRSINPVFTITPGEKIFGCGESATKLDKVGQKVNLFVTDPQGPETDMMYKPIPFFMSNMGYGMFMHTSAPVTCDFGATNINVTRLYMGDENLDLFVFLGEPKDILDEYTNITGKSPMPPLWSFGTWMSRITYLTQQEGYDVAANLRKHKIPADVIHFDTGWFETDWQCDYEFAPSRFSDPQKMINDLKDQGFHISLWQITYFTPKNRYFKEIIEKGLHVKNGNEGMPYEDAVLDFSNPEAVKWYQEKIGGLIKMGVGAIKADFGEAAPFNGLYASGKTGYYEHNLYPLRYNKAVVDVTHQVSGDFIEWARSAWAGSQRYPLHWGGDAANTDYGMEGTLRAGLSFGLSGFPFWSHDIGGFVVSTPVDLYRRWLPFGFLSSHSRAHGAPPTEPWLYKDQNMVKYFRESAELKYKLMPYVYAEAKECTEKGLPMVRAMFVEFPNDFGSWQVENQYMFGSRILVAPMFTPGQSRQVYLPAGKWIDYQSGKVYTGSGNYQEIPVGEIQAVILVRDGSILPHIKLAQSTKEMDWSKLALKVYSVDVKEATGQVCLPSEGVLHNVSVKGGKITAPTLAGKTKLTID